MDKKIKLAYKRIKRWNPLLELLTYAPIQRGLLLLVITSFTFPISGVFITRMNLLPIRFLLMHGVIRGGAIGLAFQLTTGVSSLFINLLLIIVLNKSSKCLNLDYGQLTIFFMISTIAIASIIINIYQVPAKDTLSLLWGSLYVTSIKSIISAIAVAFFLVLFTIIFFRQLTALFYDRDVALSMGIKANLYEFIILLSIALVVAISMHLMGALLLDAVILLPVIISNLLVDSLKKMLIMSCILGGSFAIIGFFTSLAIDIPLSAGVPLPAVIVFLVTLIIKQGFLNEKIN